MYVFVSGKTAAEAATAAILVVQRSLRSISSREAVGKANISGVGPLVVVQSVGMEVGGSLQQW